MQNEFQAFLADEASVSFVKNWADRQGLSKDTVETGTLSSCLATMETQNPPKLLLVDYDPQQSGLDQVARLVKICGVGCKVILTGVNNDVRLYRELTGLGVADYLVKPLAEDILTKTMAQILRGEGKASLKDARVLVTIGARGGVGTSSIAVNLAWILAEEHHKTTALVDLDLSFGISALALDLEPGRGLRDMLSSPQRVDSLMIQSSLAKLSKNLTILSAEEGVDETINVDGAATTTLVKEMRSDYDAIILDVPRSLLPSQKRLLTLAHDIVIVSEQSLVGIRDTLRLITLLKNLSAPARISVVTSRVPTTLAPSVDRDTFEKGVGTKIDAMIPDDPKTANAASNSGKSFPVVGPSSPSVKALRSLALLLFDAPKETEKKPGFLGWLLGKDEAGRGDGK